MAGGGEESKGGRVCGERLFLTCIWVEVPRYFNFSIKQQLTVGKVEASVQPVVPGLLSSLVSRTGVEGWERACTHHVGSRFFTWCEVCNGCDHFTTLMLVHV